MMCYCEVLSSYWAREHRNYPSVPFEDRDCLVHVCSQPLVNTELREIFIDIICYFLLKTCLIKPATLLELTPGVVRG